VITVDAFGNINTNVYEQDLQALPEPRNLVVRLAGREIRGLSNTFGDRPAGELIALIDSDHSLAVAVVNGSAARDLGVDIGEAVEITW
jgi:S-adenosylmethionine hydrolase